MTLETKLASNMDLWETPNVLPKLSDTLVGIKHWLYMCYKAEVGK